MAVSVVETPAAAAAERRTPYQGLVPYTETDADWFFGRDQWCEVVGDNLRAYRITVLYGTSGVGKSSVLRAGPLHRLTDEARGNVADFGVPRLLPVVFSAWSLDDPLAALKDGIAAAARGITPELAAGAPEAPLADVLEAWPERIEGPLLLVLDQFEEFFLYHDRPGDPALDEVATALRRRNPAVHFLLSLREDSLAKLDRFKGHVPGLLDHLLRIDHLERHAAREAIVLPLERWGERTGEEVEAESALVEAVLDQVTTGRVSLAEAGASAAAPTPGAGEGIVAPYLQLVLERLWHEEHRRFAAQPADEPRVLSLQTLIELGGAERIVSTHLDAALARLPQSEQDVAGRVFRQLVTPSRAKIALRVSDLADLTDLPESRIEPLVTGLTGDVRILRPAGEGRYEIYHDALSGPILDWSARWHERQRRRRDRRRLMILGGLVVVLVGIVVAAGLALLTIRASQERADRAHRDESRLLAVQAVGSLDADSLTGLRVAVQAWDISHTSEAEEALRGALAADLLRDTLVEPDPVYGVAFSPDNSTLATASASGTVRIWDSDTGRSLQTLTGHTGPVYGVGFSPDGRTLVTAGADGTVRLWDVSSGRRLTTLRGKGGYVTTVAFSPDGATLVTGDADGSVLLWDVRTDARRVLRLNGNQGAVYGVAFSPDGRTLASAGEDGSVLLWDVRTRARLGQPLIGRQGAATSVAFSPDASTLATGSDDGSVRLWDVRTRTRPVMLVGHRGGVTSIAFSPDGRTLATGSDDGTARLWDSDHDQQLSTVLRQTGNVTGIAFSPDARRLVTASSDGTALVWDVESGRQLRVLRSNGGALGILAFSSDHKSVVPASRGTARILDVATSHIAHTLSGDVGTTTAAAFSPDDELVVVASKNGTARVWKVASGKRLQSFLPDRPAGPIYWTAFNREKTVVVTAGADGKARVWEIATGRSLHVLEGHPGPGGGAAFSPDGKLFVTARADGTVRIWRCNVCSVPLEQLLARAKERLAASG